MYIYIMTWKLRMKTFWILDLNSTLILVCESSLQPSLELLMHDKYLYRNMKHVVKLHWYEKLELKCYNFISWIMMNGMSC